MSRLRDELTSILMAAVVGVCALSAASVDAQPPAKTSIDANNLAALDLDGNLSPVQNAVSAQTQVDLLSEDFRKYRLVKEAEQERDLRRSADEYNSGRMADTDRAEFFRKVQAYEIVLPAGVALKPYERSTADVLTTWFIRGLVTLAFVVAAAMLAMFYVRWTRKRAASAIIRLPVHRGLARLCRTLFVILAVVLCGIAVVTLLIGSPGFLLSLLALLILHPTYMLAMWVIEGFFPNASADLP